MRSIMEMGDVNAITTESLTDSLTDRAGGGLRVGVPADQNQPQDDSQDALGLPQMNTGSQRHKYRPNLSIGTGGLASQSGGSSGPANIGRPTGGAHGTISRGEDGTVVVTRTEKYSSGTTITSSVTYDRNGNTTRTDGLVTNPDGSTSSSGVVQTEDGSWVEYEVETDKEGNVTSDEMREYDRNGDPVKDNDLAGQPGIDGESDSDVAEFLRSWHRSVYGPEHFEIKIPAHFNPGTPENDNSLESGPRLRHEGIATNPDPTKAAGGQMSREMAQRMQQELKDKAAGGFGPGPKPPKE
jgi:hypothetical protein